MNARIRYDVSGDVDACELGRLLHAASQSSYSKEQLDAVIAGSSAYVTARDGEKLVAFGRLLSDGAVIAYINNMAVDPSYQGRGIGRALLEKLTDIAREVTSIYLYTDTADEFYAGCGFRPSEKRLYVRRKLSDKGLS